MVDARDTVERNPARLVNSMRPWVVEANDTVETYPLAPSPATVDARLNGPTPPGPKEVEKEEIAAAIEEFAEDVDI